MLFYKFDKLTAACCSEVEVSLRCVHVGWWSWRSEVPSVGGLQQNYIKGLRRVGGVCWSCTQVCSK